MPDRPAIRLVATDIDGTLIDANGLLPGNTLVALQQAADAGVQLVLATIRKYDSTEPYARLIDRPCILICEGGAVGYALDRTRLFEYTIPLDLAAHLAALADQHHYQMVITINGTNFYHHTYTAARFQADPAHLLHSYQQGLSSAPTRMLIRGEQAGQHILSHFAQAPLQIVRHYRDGLLHDVVVTAAQATKAQAVRAVCEQLGVPLAQVLAIGDAEADIGMLQQAGIGVAVGNAIPELQAIADWVAPSVDAAGVAAAIQRFVLR